MIIPVVYFSSSNNTAYVAQIIGKGIESGGENAELVRVEDVGVRKYDVSSATVLGVGAPIYGGFAEPIMSWAKSFDFSRKRVFLFSTASETHLGSTAQMIDVIQGRGGTVIGALEMKFPGSIDGVFYSKKLVEKHPLKRFDLERALRYGRDVAGIVQKGTGYADYTYRHWFPAWLMPVVELAKQVIAFIIKRGLFESSCSGCIGASCGACASVCPVHAIKMKGECPEIDKEKCIACFRCFRECPTGTFSVRFAKDMEFYRGPWQLKGYVEPDELAKTAR
jgi:ferredoxin/flavodoxin